MLWFVRRNVLRWSLHKQTTWWPGLKSVTIIGRMESRYAFDLQRTINTLLLHPSRSPKPSGTSNVSPHPDSHNQHLQTCCRQQPHLMALHPLWNGMPFECTQVMGVYTMWTATPLNSPCIVINWSDILVVLQAAWLWVLKRQMSNVHPTGRFRGGITITGYLMLTTSPLLDTMDWVKRIDHLWMSFILSMSLLLDRVTSLMASLRYLLKGMSLYQEDDHRWLTTDPTIYTLSSDSRLLGFGFTLLDGHCSCISSQCHHCWTSSPRPSEHCLHIHPKHLKFAQIQLQTQCELSGNLPQGYCICLEFKSHVFMTLFLLLHAWRMCGVWTRKTIKTSITQRIRHAFVMCCECGLDKLDKTLCLP